MNPKQNQHIHFYQSIPLFVTLLLLTGCYPIQPVEMPNPPAPSATTTSEATTEADALANSSWQLTDIDANGTTNPVVSGSMVTLNFNLTGEAGGMAGCNSYGGTYTVTGDIISFNEIVSTLMAYTDTALMDQEQQYLQAISSADRFAVTGDQLTLWYDNGDSQLIFTAASAATPAASAISVTGTATSEETLVTTPSPTETPTDQSIASPTETSATGTATSEGTPVTTPSPSETPTDQSTASPTETSATGTATSEGTYATTPSPTETLTTASGVDAFSTAIPTRIRFGAGETSSIIYGSVGTRQTDSYILQAQAGQIMSVDIASPNNDVLLSVIGEDGTPLKRYQNGPPSWTSTLPATQDYMIEAVSVGPATDYILSIWIQPLNSDNGAERIQFAVGDTSASRSGALPEGGTKTYVLAARAGQTMHVRTVGYNAFVNFMLRSPGGTTWSGEAQGSEAYINTADVSLPETGDYTVILSTPTTAGATRYDVTFTIDAGATATTTPVANEPAERVQFAAGSYSAQRSGMLPSGAGVKAYLLSARAGQVMTVDATSDGAPLSMTIEDPTGNRLIPEMRPIPTGYAIGRQFTVPVSGDYLVTLGKADHTPSINYNVTFTIQ